jgi:hypothetical protein
VSEQRTPDELGIENEAICETLLGWKRSSIVGHWFPSQEHAGTVRTPSFTTWADAGLILDAFEGRAPVERVDSANYKSSAGEQLKKLGIVLSRGEMRPTHIRAAALAYIRSLP